MQGAGKGLGTGIAPTFAGRRGQVQHPRSQTSESAQGMRRIQITQQRSHAMQTQGVHPLRAGGQGQHAHALWQRLDHSQADIATADDQNAGASKAGRQGAWACRIQTGGGDLI